MKQIFNNEQQEKAQCILNHPLAKLPDLRSNEIKNLTVEWCYYSAINYTEAINYIKDIAKQDIEISER